VIESLYRNSQKSRLFDLENIKTLQRHEKEGFMSGFPGLVSYDLREVSEKVVGTPTVERIQNGIFCVRESVYKSANFCTRPEDYFYIE